MGGVNCIQTFFGFLDLFYIYKVPKNNFILFNIPVFLDIFQNNVLVWAFQFKCLSSVMPRKLN